MKSAKSTTYTNSTISVEVLGELKTGEGADFGIAQIGVNEPGVNHTDHVALAWHNGILRVISGTDPRYDLAIPCDSNCIEAVESTLLRYYKMQFDS